VPTGIRTVATITSLSIFGMKVKPIRFPATIPITPISAARPMARVRTRWRTAQRTVGT